MRHSTDMGKNVTGVGMAPLMSQRLIEGAERAVPSSPGDEHEMDRVRMEYSNEAPPIGSTPPPATLVGVAKAGMEMLMGHKPTVLMDKLGERLAFERTGTRLYEALLSKFDALGTWEGGPTRAELQQFHDEELEHFELVKEALEHLGGDPTAVTPAADFAAVASDGLIKVMTDPRSSLAECLQAVHVAELVDNDGWALLIRLADGLGHDEMVGRFNDARDAEAEHLQAVRSWLAQHAEMDAKRDIEDDEPQH